MAEMYPITWSQFHRHVEPPSADIAIPPSLTAVQTTPSRTATVLSVWPPESPYLAWSLATQASPPARSRARAVVGGGFRDATTEVGGLGGGVRTDVGSTTVEVAVVDVIVVEVAV